jgi:hypothetical protein
MVGVHGARSRFKVVHMAVTVCTLCNITFGTKREFNQHEKYNMEHRANERTARDADNARREAQRIAEDLQRVWDFAHRPTVVSTWSFDMSTLSAAVGEKMAYVLIEENRKLGDDLKSLVKDMAYCVRRFQEEGISRIEAHGASAVYQSITSTSSVNDIPVTTGKVQGRRECLSSLSNALRVRCESLHAPAEWARMERLAAMQVVEVGGSAILSNGSDVLTFPSLTEAIAAGVELSKEAK